jgi:hypothetical protein
LPEHRVVSNFNRQHQSYSNQQPNQRRKSMIISDLNHLEIAGEDNQVQGGVYTYGSAGSGTSGYGVLSVGQSQAGSISTPFGSAAGAGAAQLTVFGYGDTYSSANTGYSSWWW